MSSFKGTKGKWKLFQFPEGQMSVRNIENTRKICVGRVQNYEESEANLLLISKAPEMLEMLEELSASLHFLNSNNMRVTKDKIDNLIKEATTL